MRDEQPKQNDTAAPSAPTNAEADYACTREEVAARAAASIEALEAIADDYALLAELDPDAQRRLLIAAGRISRPERDAQRALRRRSARKDRDARRAHDAAVLDETGIRTARRAPVFETPAPAIEAGPQARAARPKQRPYRRAPLPPGVEPGSDEPTALPSTLPSALISSTGSSDRDPERASVIEPRNCYVCKRDYDEIHSFYDSMCSECADFNWLKRIQTADLSGRVALVTGARVKIGYQAAIKLLRAGASVIATTRFPNDAAARFSKEADFAAWSGRLEIHGLDLRHTPSIEALAEHLCARWQRLDFVLNNACQTVRRPPGFYAHMIAQERAALSALAPKQQQLLESHRAHVNALEAGGDGMRALPATTRGRHAESVEGYVHAAALSQVPLLHDDLHDEAARFPAGALDADLQQVDLREKNSWRLGLEEVSAVELLEVHLVNAIAPFILNARLKPLMTRTPGADKHIVNVSAMEGQFYRSFKTDKHPHTNMAKAGLNMMTRTSARAYLRDGIHMNSVDTGWITDEDPLQIAEQKRREHGFHPPLDSVDAAARICDPIFSGLNTGHHVWGQFLKDYAPTDW